MQGQGNQPFGIQQQFGNIPPQHHQPALQFQQPPQQQQGFPSSTQNPMGGYGYNGGNQQQQQQQYPGGFGQQPQPNNPMAFTEQQGGFNYQQQNNFGQQSPQGFHNQHQQGPMYNGSQMGGQFQQQQPGFQQGQSGGGNDLQQYKDLSISFISSSMKEGIGRGEYITSYVNKFYLCLTKSGELVCFSQAPSNVYWSAGIQGGFKAIVDDQGNFKIVDQPGNTLWQISSNANVRRADTKKLTLKEDGSMELQCGRKTVWSTQPGPKN